MDKLGYACINMTLADNKITVNRGMVKKTFQSKGLAYVSELTILNIKDMVEIIKWNERNGIKNYRMSSDMFPWFSEYKIEDLPNYNIIKNLMRGAGTLVKSYGHKVSLHPGPFNCLASPNEDVVRKTIYELEQHSKLMDLMEFHRSEQEFTH
jgi:UV DNA damage endonuclease